MTSDEDPLFGENRTGAKPLFLGPRERADNPNEAERVAPEVVRVVETDGGEAQPRSEARVEQASSPNFKVPVTADPDPAKPSPLEASVIQALRKAGYPKPEGVTWGQWVGPKKLSHRHELVCMKAALGSTASDIAREFGYTDGRMSIILNTPRVKAAVANLRERFFGANIEARFKGIVPKAVTLLEAVIDSPSEKTSNRLDAAKEVLNRSLGKSKETVEIKTSSVRDVFVYLDQMRTAQQGQLASPSEARFSSGENSVAKTPGDLQTKNGIPATIDGELLSEETKTVRAGIDDWIGTNVPAGEGIGKREPKV